MHRFARIGFVFLVGIITSSRVHALHENETLFLHVGKAGGGTVFHELLNANIPFRRCHPHPCPPSLFQNFSTILVTIRDPVDRYVSAFNWRSHLLCKLHNETRTPNGALRFRFPDKYCEPNNKTKEAYILHDKYSWDPNKLAEALCRDDNGEASQDLREIRHANHFLIEWFQGRKDSWKRDNTTLIAVVQEPGFDFVEQTHSAIDWIISQSNITNATTFLQSSKGNNQTKNLRIHEFGNHTSTALSPLGTCCMARHLAGDYELLKQLQVCRYDSSSRCKGAIASILKRRELALDQHFSCHDQTQLTLQELDSLVPTEDEAHVETFYQDSYTTFLWLLLEMTIVIALLGVYYRKCK